ncbi:MAG: outer membrane beta-barrel protein [Sedimentisphaerales bacterium]
MNCGISLGFNLSGWRGRIDEFIRNLEMLTNYIGLSPNYSRSLRDGYEVGLFLCYRPFSWMSIQSELNLMNQGLRIAGSGKISGNDYSIVQRFNVNYYQIPLILKFIEMKSGVYACAGAFVQYTTSGKLTTEVTIDTESDSDSKKIDNLSDRDYGYILGIGLDLSGGSFELRYITGLNEVFNSGTNDYGFRNYSIELRLEILLFSKHSR